ncbi:MAG: hypothetical protein JY451_04385 [Erythrobacter sp.]|nr:MAG: hypothetical protein JY451_04385 [Erythrobacter sp.]
MSSRVFTSSRPDRWTSPRAMSDPSLRLAAFGRIQPMEQPGLLERLFSRR